MWDAGERERVRVRAHAWSFGATTSETRDGTAFGRMDARSDESDRRARGRLGGGWAGARSALHAVIAMIVIAATCGAIASVTRKSESGLEARERREAGEAWEKAAATAEKVVARQEEESGERELLIGDNSVAYVSMGWNAERRLVGDDGIETIWEGPAAENEKGELEATAPVGALLVLHGCHHSAKDWFANNTKCETCRGVAQEMSVTRTALNRGFVVIAVSAYGTCWSKDIDAPRMEQVLNTFFNDTALSNLPLYAFGASSGGSFVGMLPQMKLPVQPSGLIIQIAPGPTLENTPRADLSMYPPTVFSYMPKDERTSELIARSIADFKRTGVQVKESKLHEHVVSDTFFYEESFGKITKEESVGLTNTLNSFNLLDADGKLTNDPRAFDDDHVEVLKKHAPVWDSMLADQSDVRELLNVAYATHELSAQEFGQNLKWLMVHSQQKVNHARR